MRFFCLAMMMTVLWSGAALATGQVPRGWTLEGTDAAKNFDLGTEALPGGNQAAFLRAHGGSSSPAALMQVFDAPNYAGNRIRMRGTLKTQDADEAYLFVVVFKGETLIRRALTQSVKGTADRKDYEIALGVPADATQIKIGFLLKGAGTAWVDGLAFETVAGDEASPGLAQGSGVTAPSDPAWIFSAQQVADYETGLEAVAGAAGKSAFVRSRSSGLGTMRNVARMTVMVPVEGLRGKRISLATRLKLEGADRAGCAAVVVDADGQAVYAPSQNRSGTSDWQGCGLIMQVPANAAGIFFRYDLVGEGKLWSDGLRVAEVGSEMRLSGMANRGAMPCDLARQFQVEGIPASRCNSVGLGF